MTGGTRCAVRCGAGRWTMRRARGGWAVSAGCGRRGRVGSGGGVRRGRGRRFFGICGHRAAANEEAENGSGAARKTG